MSVLTQALGQFGARHTIKYKGRDYFFRPFSLEMEDAFQHELYRRYREKAAKLPSVLKARDPDAALADKLEALERQFLAGGFEFESEAGTEFLRRAEGKAFLVTLIVEQPSGENKEQFEEFLADRALEVIRLIDLTLCESMPGYAARKAKQEANGTPGKGPAPGQPTPAP